MTRLPPSIEQPCREHLALLLPQKVTLRPVIDIALGGKPEELHLFRPLHLSSSSTLYHCLHAERHWTAGPLAYTKVASAEALAASKLLLPPASEPTEAQLQKTKWPFGSEEPLHALRRKVFNLSETPSVIELQAIPLKLASFFDSRRQQAFAKMILPSVPDRTVNESVSEKVWEQDTQAFGAAQLDGIVWHLFSPADLLVLLQFLQLTKPEALHSLSRPYLDEALLAKLKEQHAIQPTCIVQYEGESLIIPPGWAAQAVNYADVLMLSTVLPNQE